MSRTRLRLGAAALAATLTSTLVATLATPATSAPVPPEDPELLVVGTYNIRSDRSVSEFLEGVEPFKDRVHVAGLQEIGANDKNKLLKADVDWGYLRPPEVQQNPVIWRRDLFDYVGTPTARREYRLARARRVERPGGGMEKKRATWATVARLDHRATGTPISVVNVHLLTGSLKGGRPHPGRPKRYDLYTDQLRRTVKIAKAEQSRGRTVYVTGDFNSDYQTDNRIRLRKLPFRKFKSIGYKSMWKGRDLSGRGTLKKSHLDNVWNRAKPVAVDIAHDIDVSDHHPAIASYRLPPPETGYQPSTGTIGFSSAEVVGVECDYITQAARTQMRFRLEGEMRYGYPHVEVRERTAQAGRDFTIDLDGLYDNDLGTNEILVTIVPNLESNGDRSFQLVLTDPVNTEITRSTAMGYINDDEPDNGGVPDACKKK